MGRPPKPVPLDEFGNPVEPVKEKKNVKEVEEKKKVKAFEEQLKEAKKHGDQKVGRPKLDLEIPEMRKEKRAKHPAKVADSPALNVSLSADTTVAQRVRSTPLFGSQKENGGADKFRLNLVSEPLVDDIITYMGDSLLRHVGCDLIDLNPGCGLWSTKLNDLLRPRTHILLEPYLNIYQPFLDPLAQRPGVKIFPLSGFVWDELARIMNSEHLPHQTKLTPEQKLNPPQNDTLLVTMNIAYSRLKSFGSYPNLQQFIIHQLLNHIRANSHYQQYGKARMLLWVNENGLSNAALPRNVQNRNKWIWEVEMLADITQITTADSPSVYYQRDRFIDLQGTQEVAERMREAGIVVPPGRETDLLKQVTSPDYQPVIAGKQPRELTFLNEEEWKQLEAKNAESPFPAPQTKKTGNKITRKSHPEFERLRYLRYVQVRRRLRDRKIHSMLVELQELRDLLAQAGPDNVTEELKQKVLAWNTRMDYVDKSLRMEFYLMRDNLDGFERKILNYDRRPFEPLKVKPREFIPNVGGCLIDIQPRDVDPILRTRGPGTSGAANVFDLLLDSLNGRPALSARIGLEQMAHGAVEGVWEETKSLFDPARGGSPVRGHDELAPRRMNSEQLMDLFKTWDKWPFKPSYSQLLSRVHETRRREGEFEDELNPFESVAEDLD